MDTLVKESVKSEKHPGTKHPGNLGHCKDQIYEQISNLGIEEGQETGQRHRKYF